MKHNFKKYFTNEKDYTDFLEDLVDMLYDLIIVMNKNPI